MSNYNFIKTSDEDTKNLLAKQGLQLINEDNGTYTFMNNASISFEKSDKICYSNILNM